MNRTEFFNAARAGILGPTLDQGEVDGCNAILDAFEGQPLCHVAYALGTAYLETGGTMRPVKEWGGDKYLFRMYDIRGDRPAKARELGNLTPGDGVRYCGRGYPQVTGKANYAKAEEVFGVPFVADPDLMLVPRHAAAVMAHFMKHGLFTGKKLADYLPTKGPALPSQLIPARRIINGTDRAADVARFAFQFQKHMIAAGWE